MIIKLQARFRGYLERKNVIPKLKKLAAKRNPTRIVATNEKGRDLELTYEDGSKFKGNILLTLRATKERFKRRLWSAGMA